MKREAPIVLLAIALAVVLVACMAGGAGEQRPADGEQRPATSDQHPAVSAQRPAASGQRPAASDQRPATSDQHPAPSVQPPAPAQPTPEMAPRLLSNLIDGQGIRSWGVTTAVVDGWLEIRSGHGMPWPSVAIDHPADLTGYGAVAVDVRNPGPDLVQVSLRLDVKTADGRRLDRTRVLPLAPGASGVLAVELDTPAVPGFEPLHLDLIPPGFGGPMAPDRVVGAVIFIDRPTQDFTYAVANLRAVPRQGPVYAPAKPFIDRYGQFIPAAWPGKIASDADFAAVAAAEASDLASHPAPADWDAWGGWAAGPQLPATGRFRTEKVAERWWLVDPDGRLFWSQGATCVGLLDDTPLDGREDWFADLPADLAAFPDCRDTFAWLGIHRGPYAGKQPKTFSFAQANLERKHGAGWRQASADLVHRRFRSWGLNTFGNWSDPALCDLHRTVYTVPLHPAWPAIAGSGVADPWDARFAAALREALAKRSPALGDPWCLGFFVGNEIPWGDDAHLGRCAAKAPPEQPAKRALVEALRASYGDIGKLNAAWGTAHASWEALLAAREEPKGDAALADLRAFTRHAAARWFGVCGEVIHQADAKALFLGTRMCVWNPAVVAAAAASCDVMSFNIYRTSVADFAPDLPCPDRPMLITEFHTGATDRGLPRGGLVLCVATQAERAERYSTFVVGALRHPGLVGAHWFEYRDEPATGRKIDGEDFQIGFVDVTDTPYPDMVAAARKLAVDLYPRRAGR